MKTILLLILSTCVALSEVSQEERAFIKKEQEAIRKTLVGLLQVDSEGEIIVPSDVFHRELELILGPYAGRRPYGSSALGEKFKRLALKEKKVGLTLIVQGEWTDLFWDWRNKLEGE